MPVLGSRKVPSWGEQWWLEPANSTTATGSGLSFSIHWWPRLGLGDWGVGSGMWWLAIPPGLALCSWAHRSAGEASGLTGKHEGPRPLPCGKSPSEPLVNLDAIAALLCQSHQPCMSRGWRRDWSQPPTEPPFLTPLLEGCYRPDCCPERDRATTQRKALRLGLQSPRGTWDGDEPWLGTKGGHSAAPTCREGAVGAVVCMSKSESWG